MQVLLVVVLFILVFCMVPLFVLSASFSVVLLFQSGFMSCATSSSCEWFCSISHFIWLFSSDCVFWGVSDMSQPVTG